jgi:glycosyltransferase involved in cell wall biosynthesis
LEDSVEIVIVDGGSTDGTEQVVSSYQRAFPSISYVRKETSEQQPSNEGFSRDCNHAVELANGKYCWLMTDDDLLLPGAIRKVLSETEKDYPVIVASVEVRNDDLTKVLIPRRPNLLHDQIYKPSEWNNFAVKVGGCLTFVGAVIIKRQFWLNRDREKYFRSAFIHVGVIFDEPIMEDVLVIAAPLVSVRHGNAHWSNRTFQIWLFNWPELVWSFSTISDGTKQILAPKERWRNLRALLLMRALGIYSLKEYELFLIERLRSKREHVLAKLIARLPRSVLYIPAYVYLYVRGSKTSSVLFELENSWRREEKNELSDRKLIGEGQIFQ